MLLACCVILLAVALYLWKHADSLFTGAREIRWVHVEWVDHPAPALREAIVQCFGPGKRVNVTATGTVDIYTRGDPSITCVSRSDGARWSDIPGFFSVGVVTIDGRTLVSLRIEVLDRVKMFRSAVEQFAEKAQAEFDRALTALKEAAARQQQASSSQRREKQPHANSVISDCQADYAVLGVRPGAPFEEVRAAYRDACRKYHPDALTGKNVEPHLVDLAARRFKEVSTAYGRLRDHLAPSRCA